MLRLVEDGEMYRLRRFWDARKPECIQSAKRNIIHVGIREFSCALAVFSLGVLVSSIVFICEVISHYKLFSFKLIIEIVNERRKQKSQNVVKGVIVPYVN